MTGGAASYPLGIRQLSRCSNKTRSQSIIVVNINGNMAEEALRPPIAVWVVELCQSEITNIIDGVDFTLGVLSTGKQGQQNRDYGEHSHYGILP